MQRQRRRNLIGWEKFLRILVGLSHSGWVRLVAKVTSALLAALAILMLLLIAGFRYAGLHIVGDRIYFGSQEIGQISPDPNSNLRMGSASTDPNILSLGQITVEANAGFQNSGIYLNQGDKVILEADGRINLASRQVHTFLGLIKPIIADQLEAEVRDYKENYKDKNSLQDPDTGGVLQNLATMDVLRRVTQVNSFAQRDTFRRDWVGIDGEEIDSYDLNPCLLFTGQGQTKKWGMLLAQVLQDPGSAVTDPLQVLSANDLQPSQLIPISHENFTFEAKRDGWLTFIVNDVVLSGGSEATKLNRDQHCKEFYKALQDASSSLRASGSSEYVIPERSIPLVWYSDNIGSFHVVVRHAIANERL